ncbi:magnesium chelatase subunit H [Leptolyngbya sp. AN03gr2]|uniref:magnesium chelatase subunit H n=1 Tax=Leptolyngbya sp. AN03gr2 TaxID=3423364 RepID=UPI003D320D12
MSQTLPRLTLISSASPLGDLPSAIAQVTQQYGTLFEVVPLLLHQLDRVEDGLETIQRSKAVLFDLRGNPESAIALIQRALIETQGEEIAFIPVFGGGPSVMAMTRMKAFALSNMPSSGTDYRQMKQSTRSMVEKLPPEAQYHARNWSKCVSYWTNSGVENLANLLKFVAAEYADVPIQADEPIVYPDFGFLDLNTHQRYSSYLEYVADHPLDPNCPTVAVLFYSGTSMTFNLQGGAELFAELSESANVLPFFADGIKTAEALEQHFFNNGVPICDAIVSLLWFRLDGGPLGGDAEHTIALLKALDVPYYVAVTSNNREIAVWEQTAEGLPPVETLSTVAFPELDGAIDPVIIYGLNDQGAATPIPGRGKRLAQRILKRIALRRKTNIEKKIAIVIFNYPPSEGTLGTASFLDVFASVEHLLDQLQQAGYSVTPPEVGTLKDLFLDRGLLHNGDFTSVHLTANHAIRVPLEQYLQWYDRLPDSIQKQTESVFGSPPGDLMSDRNDLLIAGIEFGNVVVAIQPSRGVHEDPSKLHHDDSLPAHHQYIGFYRWLEEGWNADAVVHVGTHGTFEFLPGKQVALDEGSAPDALLGNLPNSYIYHVVNVSEGTIAKRRSYAQLVSYASPTFVPAGLYEHLTQLEDLLDEYEDQKTKSLPRAIAILRQIIQVCDANDVLLLLTDELKQNIEDLSLYETALETLHIDLFELKRVAIPIGLHTFGHRLQDEALIDYLTLVARYDRAETPSLPRLLAQQYGWNYDQLLDSADSKVIELGEKSRSLIAEFLLGETVQEPLQPTFNYLDAIAKQIAATDEVRSLLDALEGKYIEPGLGGDPVRTPHTYPTGRNTYQFDPTKLPTDSAYDRGAQIAEETLSRYYAEHGTYPDAVGVILWGFETCKTYGETIGQILRYIGVKVDRGQGYFMRPVVIPISELNRPRVDVTVNICGFFRDLFPNLVRLIDLAFQMVAQLDEPLEQNAVRRHTLAVSEQLDFRLASARLFGPPPGEYGNRLSTMIETAAWESESDLGEMYIDRTQYLYGDRLTGTESRQAFTAALGRTKFITQVRDSHEFEVTDIDHYYEFFGGMAQAATLISGDRPEVLIADTTKERIQVKTITEAVRQGVTSRLFNPKWIDGMLNHAHQGGQAIADRVEYLLGLDATTRSVGTATWSRVAERFVFDAEMRERMLENNRYAESEIIRKLGEADHRGYWDANETQREQLQQIYCDIETQIELGLKAETTVR